MADGTELFACKWSHPDPSATVLIIHGISEHLGRWSHVAEFFVSEGFEVFCYDQRSHGQSGSGVLDVEDFSQFLEDVSQTIAEIRTTDRPLVIYGHSMGGLIATLYAESDYEQPDLLVLSAPPLDVKAAVPGYLRVAAGVFSKVAPKLALASSVKKEHLSRNPEVGEAYVNDPLVYLKATTRFGKSFFDAMDEGRAAIDKIRVPTLVVHGADDELVPPQSSAPLAAVPGIQRRVFPGLRHEMHNEPEAREVLGFVAGWIKDHVSP
jgi:alpha-beta hydrolase superfamily lysophospholipase